ncbi:MAG TPA: hypothetical protein VGS12_05495 [Caulobacteraceae bacterium]|nr:hypothetical protein [Caulobacteraceae bacterium]
MGRVSILDFPPRGGAVDRTGAADVSFSLAAAVTAANSVTATGKPACVYIPAGIYRIVHAPPPFVRAGCVHGEGSSQSILQLDRAFSGDLFAWSEAWSATTPGPTVVGLKIVGDRRAAGQQNALTFYDRNDRVFVDDVEVDDLPGRAIYSGATKHVSQAYMRESHLRSLRFFDDGAAGVPVIEFSSQGMGRTDASNEIRLSQVDIFGSYGPSFVVRNGGEGHVRAITVEAMRIEGLQNGHVPADLITIGDPKMRGNVNTISFTDLELIDPYPNFAALRLTAAPGAEAPYQIKVTGWIGGGNPQGQGLRIDAGRSSVFRLSGLHTHDTNVVIGPHVDHILLDGDGRQACWTYQIDPTSLSGIMTPVLAAGDPSHRRSPAPMTPRHGDQGC